jgi:S-adenosylmethionine hydrolase
MKGAILSVCADARIIDITHKIPAHDIHTAAFTLLASYQTFPRGTIHVAVVDPGVGSNRKPILIQSENYFFIAPDNGLLSYVAERENKIKVFHLTNEKFFRQPVSATFHGRDVFAPVAAQLACGVEAKELGEEIDDYVQLGSLNPTIENETIQGSIINIDRFGNIVTNITPEHLTEKMIERGLVLKIGEHKIERLQNFYAEANEGETFAIWGSAGFLEIVAFKDSAARLLNVKIGDNVIGVNLQS